MRSFTVVFIYVFVTSQQYAFILLYIFNVIYLAVDILLLKPLREMFSLCFAVVLSARTTRARTNSIT